MKENHAKNTFVSPNKLNSISIKPIVHAVPDEEIFLKIIRDKQIFVPSKNKGLKRKDVSMDKLVGIDDCCFFSGGFDYNSKFHQWEFGVMFAKAMLKEKNFSIYKTYPVARGWLVFLRYIRDFEPEVLSLLRGKAKDYVDKFLERDSAGLFFKYEKELNWALSKVQNKLKLKKLISNYLKDYKIKNLYAPRYVGNHYTDDWNDKTMEIASTKSVDLNSKYFLGFYLSKNQIKKIIPILKKEFSPKIVIYDGAKVRKLGDF